MSPHHNQWPRWLIQATESSKYIDEAWTILALREHQRSLASAASQPRKHRLRGPSSPTVDSSLISHYSISTAVDPKNKFFNRYCDVVPYNRNRVIPSGSNQRYLNASWIQTRASGQWFVATQAPLIWTANSLLSLTVADSTGPQGQQFGRVRTIVQLTPEWEGRIRKADPYFPSEIGETWTLQPEAEGLSEPLCVTLAKRTVHSDMNCIESELHIRLLAQGGEELTVTHLLYTSWPDHGVPEKPESLLRFIRYCEQVNESTVGVDRESMDPMVVGCSAGIGRTGSFIAISSVLQAMRSPDSKVQETRTSGVEPSLSSPGFGEFADDMVVAEIDWLREQRGGMVQKREQMEMIYRILCA